MGEQKTIKLNRLKRGFREFKAAKHRRSGVPVDSKGAMNVYHSSTGRKLSMEEFQNFRRMKARLMKVKFAGKASLRTALGPSMDSATPGTDYTSEESDAPERVFTYQVLDAGRVLIFGNAAAEFQTTTADWGETNWGL